jgi:hypothetical protein
MIKAATRFGVQECPDAAHKPNSGSVTMQGTMSQHTRRWYSNNFHEKIRNCLNSLFLLSSIRLYDNKKGRGF